MTPIRLCVMPLRQHGKARQGPLRRPLPRVLTRTLVGNFGQGAHTYRRGGVTVEATNSHSDLFVKDITMLRAEERLGLGLYRPAAFTAVSGLA